jgi:hypothetical protein
MAQENFNVSEPNDGLGDKLRAAFIKVQANFTDLFTNKVDKEIGKGLSSQNYTTVEKNKLANIEDFAEVNVQSDMAQNDETADDFIKNKQSIFGLATTQIINVGSIGSAEIQDVVNLDDGYVIQGQELGIRLVTSNDNGIEKNYLFLAPGGSYGIDLLQTVAADFQIFGGASTDISGKQNIPRLVDTDTTALNNEILHVTADATITDVVGAVAGNFFTVRVLEGVGTIDGVAYGVGTLITRNYDGTVWTSQVGGGGVSRCVWVYNEIFDDVVTGTTALTIIRTIEMPKKFLDEGRLEIEIVGERNNLAFNSFLSLKISDVSAGLSGLTFGISDTGTSQFVRNHAIRRNVNFGLTGFVSSSPVITSDDTISKNRNNFINAFDSINKIKNLNFLKVFIQNSDTAVISTIKGYSIKIFN